MRPYPNPKKWQHPRAETRGGARRAAQGMTVFRLQRDEGYLARMLACVARLHTQHVRPGAPPPPLNAWWQLPEYHAFLDATRAVAAAAALVAVVDAPALPPGADLRPFLD